MDGGNGKMTNSDLVSVICAYSIFILVIGYVIGFWTCWWIEKKKMVNDIEKEFEEDNNL